MSRLSFVLFPLLLLTFSDQINAADRVPASFPTNSSAWSWTGSGAGHPPEPGQPMGIIYDGSQSKWFFMGRRWGDNVHQYLYTSPNGLDTWTEVAGNPVISYDHSWPTTDTDFYWQMPNYGRNPDGSLKKWNAKFVIVGVNYDGTDTHPQSLTSDNGTTWSNRTDISGISGPVGSGDTGETWPTQLIYNPDDSSWYFFYHGGGASRSGNGRTIGVAKGTTPSDLSSLPGSFEDNNRISHNALILRDSEGWKMIFQHGFDDNDGLWVATSTGGLEPSNWVTLGQFTVDHIPRLSNWSFVDNQDGTITWRIHASNNGEKGVWTATSLSDTDGDGVPDLTDNCPSDTNLLQENNDGDAEGDVCDVDDDNDGLTDVFEASINTNPLLSDSDADSVSDFD